MKKQLIVAMILSTFFAAGCEVDSQTPDSQSLVVNYGTSFGMCIGACRKEISVEKDKTTFTVYVSQGRGGANPTTQTYNEKNTNNLSNELSQNLDYEAFMKLDERIGCPDCADGGAEFVEIIKGDRKHKVTFEYGKSPKEIVKLVTILREKRVYFEQKYLK